MQNEKIENNFVWKLRGGSWVSHIASQKIYIEAGTSRWSAVISACTVAASLHHRTQYNGWPPCLELNAIQKTEKQRLEVLHLFRCFTHSPTHTVFLSFPHGSTTSTVRLMTCFRLETQGSGLMPDFTNCPEHGGTRHHLVIWCYMIVWNGLLWHNRQQGAVPDQAGTSKCWCSSHSFHLVQAIMPGVFLVLRSTKSVPRRSFPSTLAEMSLLQLVMACWRHRIGFVSCNPSIHRGGWFQCLAVPFLVELND